MDINSYISSGIIETYVMGLCSPEEKIEMESLRHQYPQLNEAVLQYEIDLENDLLKNATPPGTEVDEQVLRSLRSLNTPVVDLNPPPFKTKKLNWLKPVAAAAILLLAVSSIFNYVLYKKTNKDRKSVV